MDRDTRTRLQSQMREQRGLITAGQLMRIGISSTTVARWEGQGSLVRAGIRTYRAPVAPPGWETDVAAACLEVGGVASHLTAAALFRLVGHPPVIDVLVVEGGPSRPSSSHPSTKAIRIHRTTSLPSADVLTIDGVPTTSVARTLLNVGALVPRWLEPSRYAEIVGKAVDDELATDRWLWWLLEHRRCRGRNGVTAMEAVLADRQRLGPTESWLEREILRILEAAGVELPVTQRIVRRRGRSAARVDFLYERTRAVIEAMGYRYHRTPEQADADAQRSIDLQAAGYRVFHLFAQRIVADPDSVVRTARLAMLPVEPPDHASRPVAS